jgi:hypothetical protein
MQIVQDDDNDGTPNGVDGCEDDAEKTEPGDCGCGQVDSDGNENGVSDCLLNPDVKERIASLTPLVSSLKFTRTPSSRKNKKRKKAQKETLEMIEALIGEISTTMTANLAQYSLTDPAANLADLLNDAETTTLRAQKTGSRRFNKFKKQALKALGALNAVLAA